MTVTARKYNPGFLSDDELVASFCVRTGEFASMVEVLRDSTGKANTHQIVIGPRGSGKTSLLLRVAAEIRRDADLSSRFFLIVFAEESYEVSTAGEFWLECLSVWRTRRRAGKTARTCAALSRNCGKFAMTGHSGIAASAFSRISRIAKAGASY